MATPPRKVYAGQSVHAVLRAVNRQHRFAPTRDVVESIEYLVWHYAGVHGVAVHEMVWMSNHAHVLLTDERGVMPVFMMQLNSMISRQLNAIRMNKGTNFEKGYGTIEILDDETMVGYCAYTLANPCEADLAATPGEWGGASTYHRNYDEPFLVRRPACGLWKNCSDGSGEDASNRSKGRVSGLPGETVGKLHRPQVMMHLSNEALRARIRSDAQVRAKRAERLRCRQNKKVAKWRRVQKTRWNWAPSKREPVFEPIPRVAGRSSEVVAAALDRLRRFYQEYRKALFAFVHGRYEQAIFPDGTWKMRRMFRVQLKSDTVVQI